MNFDEKVANEILHIEERLSMIKTLPFLYSYKDYHRECLIDNLIPGMYAIWEYYFVCILNLYIQEVNNNKIPLFMLNEKLIVLETNKRISINIENRPILNNGEFIKYRNELIDFFSEEKRELLISIETDNNVNSKVLNKMLRKMDINELNDVYITNGLNMVLKFRNAIAHGDSIKVSVDDFNEISNIILTTVYSISDNIINAYSEKRYLKKHFR